MLKTELIANFYKIVKQYKLQNYTEESWAFLKFDLSTNPVNLLWCLYTQQQNQMFIHTTGNKVWRFWIIIYNVRWSQLFNPVSAESWQIIFLHIWLVSRENCRICHYHSLNAEILKFSTLLRATIKMKRNE